MFFLVKVQTEINKSQSVQYSCATFKTTSSTLTYQDEFKSRVLSLQKGSIQNDLPVWRNNAIGMSNFCFRSSFTAMKEEC